MGVVRRRTSISKQDGLTPTAQQSSAEPMKKPRREKRAETDKQFERPKQTRAVRSS